MQLFSEKIIDLWNKYEVRVMILLSLILQIILIIFGSQRKLTARIWIRVTVWSAYLSADWVATVALGNLASTEGNSGDSNPVPKSSLQEFWAPFLLMHLGGPDTVTAYSSEDNELWLRHFLVLIIQVGVALYVFLRSWSNTAPPFISIPIFISGIIKYGERTYILRSSSSNHFKDSLPSNPDSCHDIVRYVEDTRGKRQEGSEEEMVIPQDGIDTKDHYFVLAYFLFMRSKFFFAERTLNKNEQKCIYSIFKDIEPAKEAFKLVAVELGFVYDVLYTKAAIVYSRLGILLRCITCFCSVFTLVVFSTIIDTHVYPFIDTFITYLLLVGAVLLEVFALVILFSSDWTKLWLIKLKKAQRNPISKTFTNRFWKFSRGSQSLLTNSKRWSESMTQYNLISSCLKNAQPAYIRLQKLPFMGKWLEHMYSTRLDVNIGHLQEKILQYLKEQGDIVNSDASNHKRDIFLTQRGNFALRERYDFRDYEIFWCTIAIEFVDSLIIWHIATEMFYHIDLNDIHNGDISELRSNCKISKFLSDYMFYLLVFCSSMLPEGVGEVRYKETCTEVTTIFKEKWDGISSESMAYKALLDEKYIPNNEEEDPIFLNMKGNQSLLRCGHNLHGQLLERVGDDYQQKWELISDVWVEMLVYAAHHCEWREHAQQLRNGGELLTHICLLAAHYGLSKQYFDNSLFQWSPKNDQKYAQIDLERAQDYKG